MSASTKAYPDLRVVSGASPLTGGTTPHARRSPWNPPISAVARAERGRYAILRRHHPEQPELADEALRRLRVLHAEDYVRDLVATEPTPCLAERVRLASILLATPEAGGADAA